MIRHALKLMWNRKHHNLLILCELMGAFLVLMILWIAGIAAHGRWQQPVGFEAENLWTLTGAGQEDAAPPAGTGQRLLAAAREHPQVEGAGLMYFPLYTQSGMRISNTEDGRFLLAEHIPASPGVGSVLGLELVEGRFFDERDRSGASPPVVINRALADRYFGRGAPVLDQTLRFGETSHRVLGVVETFRKGGELVVEEPVFFSPLWPDSELRFGLAALALRMRPGTDEAAQEELVMRLRAEMPSWNFDITRVADQRQHHLQERAAPLVAGAVVAVFLLAMVGLGLTGVLWQNISKRTQEIGLRRAQGATAADIRFQIGLELSVLTAVSIVLASVLAAQLPILGIVEVETSVALRAFVLSSAILILISAVCGLYPGWLAARIQPAQALHRQ